jgi:hypothetical protein
MAFGLNLVNLGHMRECTTEQPIICECKIRAIIHVKSCHTHTHIYAHLRHMHMNAFRARA